MNNNMSLGKYVCTLPIRALWSLTLSVSAFVGLAMVLDNATGNNYRFQNKNKAFETAFFGITAGFETAAVLLYTYLYFSQRRIEDLSDVNRVDCKCTCFLFFLRIAFTVTLSIFMIVQASTFTQRDVSQTTNLNSQRKEYAALEKLTIWILSAELIQLVVILLGIQYQPENFSRAETAFTDIRGQPVPSEDVEQGA